MADSPSELIARALAERGVRRVFGMPGGDVLPLLHALDVHGIDFVLVRTEASAGFMADATAQLTGTPGVCISTLGPGATNLVSGVAGALMERSRVLAITGQCADRLRGRYTHQIIDQMALFAPITVHSAHLTAADARAQLDAAFARLDHGPPGPVHINLPADVAGSPAAGSGALRVPSPPKRSPPDLTDARRAIAHAQRPVIAVGCGALGDAESQALRALVAAIGAPVITTYRAKGMIDEATDPWWAGAFGLSPVVDRAHQDLLRHADLLVAVGLDMVELRPDWLPGWPIDLPVISVDPHGQPDLLGDVSHLPPSDVAATLRALASTASPAPGWSSTDVALHRDHIARPFEDEPDGPAAAVRAIRQGSPEDTILAVDVGAHRITASHAWTSREPLRMLQSNGFSSMGVGLPMGIAARLACPEAPVVALTGDMGIWMCLGELGVVQERGLDLVVVVLADRCLSLIELKQARLGLRRTGVDFQNPDPVALAHAFGGTGHRVSGATDLKAAVAHAHAAGGLHLIEATIDPAPYTRQM